MTWASHFLIESLGLLHKCPSQIVVWLWLLKVSLKNYFHGHWILELERTLESIVSFSLSRWRIWENNFVTCPKSWCGESEAREELEFKFLDSQSRTFFLLYHYFMKHRKQAACSPKVYFLFISWKLSFLCFTIYFVLIMFSELLSKNFPLVFPFILDLHITYLLQVSVSAV